MKRLFYFIILLQMSLFLNGQPRSLEQAVNIAADYYGVQASRIAPYKQTITKAFKTEKDNSFQPIYFLVDSIEHRSILIAGDARMETIVGTIDVMPAVDAIIPPAMQDLINLYTQEYNYLQELDFEFYDAYYNAVAAPNVSPLLKTQWGQGSPYNDQCPKGCPSGCVATAMAQIMNYHQYPDRGFGKYSYLSRAKRFNLSCDFASTLFDWDNIKNYYDSNATSQQRKAVATLLYACGVAVSMDYDKDGSGAYDFDIPYAVINYFGYNPNTNCLQRDYYKLDEWMTLLFAELEAQRPVLYCGADSRLGGHAFVIDGCRSSDNKVHVNWGWNGDFDGYYVLNSLNPERYRFSTNQSMVINFSPDEVGTCEDVFYANKFEIKGDLNENVSLTGNLIEPWCAANSSSYTDESGAFNGIIGIGLFDDEMNFVKSLIEKPIQNIHTDDLAAKISLSFKLTGKGLQDGDYYIAPFARKNNSMMPTRIRTLGGKYDAVECLIIDETINGDASNDDIPNNIDVIWKEDFEEVSFPSSLSQKTIQGSGEWKSCMVIFSSSDQMPVPAHGKGYAALKSQVVGLTGQRDVCQFITDDIILTTDDKYVLYFDMRKYARKKDSNDALNVLITTENESWQTICEASIVTTSSWETMAIPLPDGVKHFRLAFEGCAGQGSSLFVDNIIIAKSIETSIKCVEKKPASREIISLDGRVLQQVQRGLNLIITSSGDLRKVLIK